MRHADSLNDTVIRGGYCIGCGACVAVAGSPYRMTTNEYGQYQACLDRDLPTAQDESACSQVCPFSKRAKNEDQIGLERYGDNCRHAERLGYWRAAYAGHVVDGQFRQVGSSGGLATWFAVELIQQRLVDRVLHVGPVAGEPRARKDGTPVMFAYRISTSVEEAMAGAKTRYYPVEMSQVLRRMREVPGRYAVVGLPCFVRAVRLLAEQDPIVDQRVRFCISLVCGHLKSTRFADLFAWQCGIPPGTLGRIDFRRKLPATPASRYGVALWPGDRLDQTPIVRSARSLIGANWGQMFFAYHACDFCDDIVGETADISIGDAWLPQYASDYQGTNIVVVRAQVIDELLMAAAGRIHLEPITMDDVARAQGGNLRHRGEGLAYRLYLADQAGTWRPPKRVAPSYKHLYKRRLELYALRQRLREITHVAFRDAVQVDSLDHFRDAVAPLMQQHDNLSKTSLLHRITRRVQRELRQRLH